MKTVVILFSGMMMIVTKPFDLSVRLILRNITSQWINGSHLDNQPQQDAKMVGPNMLVAVTGRVRRSSSLKNHFKNPFKLNKRYFGDNHEGNTDGTIVRKPFHEANAHCQQTWSGATLAIMPNIHYQWFVTSMMASVVETPWIGVISEAQDRKVFLKILKFHVNSEVFKL